MAKYNRGSRKIIINSKEFRWSVTGNDGWITIIIWPVYIDNIKLVGNCGYHDEYELYENGFFNRVKDQIIITNRTIRKILESIGIENIERSKGEIKIESLDDLLISEEIRPDSNIDN